MYFWGYSFILIFNIDSLIKELDKERVAKGDAERKLQGKNDTFCLYSVRHLIDV
jgi:hypothetical protein